MSKVSNKLAAGMRKVKVQESRPKAIEAGERKTEVRDAAAASRPVPAVAHPGRVWPD